MNRVNFITESPKDLQVFHNDALTHGRIRIYLNDKMVPGVQSMTLKVDLTYGYIVASITRHRVDAEYTHDNARPMFAIDAEHRLILDTINPNLEKDTLILESVENRDEWTQFNLRTIINS